MVEAPPPMWSGDEATIAVQVPFDAMALFTGHEHWEALSRKAGKLSTKAQYVLNYYAKNSPIRFVLGVVIAEVGVLFLQGCASEWRLFQQHRLATLRARPPEPSPPGA